MKTFDFSYSQNREISWLRFNKRVLEQGQDKQVPLGERGKFISIFDQNLDEFFMVRVGGLIDLSLIKLVPDNKSNLNAKEQLQLIYQEVASIYPLKEDVYERLLHHLKEYDVHLHHPMTLNKHRREMIDRFVERELLPIASPQIIDPTHPFPHLESTKTYLFVKVMEEHKMYYGIVALPSALKTMFVFKEEGIQFVLMEDVLDAYAKTLFKQFKMIEKAMIKVTRNADLDFKKHSIVEEDYNYRSEMKKILKKRERLVPVRLEVRGDLSHETTRYLLEHLGLKHHQLYETKVPLQLNYFFSLAETMKKKGLNALFDQPHIPPVFKPKSMIKSIEHESRLFHYPYESFAPILQLLYEAATNPNVVSIKMTIYRLAKTTKIIDYLCLAAENKKEVIVFLELRARFDEENNIHWAEVLEEAGCVLMYGIDKYKIHSKLLLITYKEKQSIRYISHVGTGNFNEQTVKVYTDMSYVTGDHVVGLEMNELFQQLLLNQLKGNFKRLLVAPKQLKPTLIEQIHQQQLLKEKGYIRIKCNALTDRDIMDALSKASRAGVQVDLLVRGICCLLPGVKHKTEHVRVFSIVGRFLEHTRVYQFGEGKEAVVYIASADLMTRNTEKRVEVGIDLVEANIKQRVLDYLDLSFSDNVKSQRLMHDGTYHKQAGLSQIDSQAMLLLEARTMVYHEKKRPTIWHRIKEYLRLRG